MNRKSRTRLCVTICHVCLKHVEIFFPSSAWNVWSELLTALPAVVPARGRCLQRPSSKVKKSRVAFKVLGAGATWRFSLNLPGRKQLLVYLCTQLRFRAIECVALSDPPSLDSLTSLGPRIKLTTQDLPMQCSAPSGAPSVSPFSLEPTGVLWPASPPFQMLFLLVSHTWRGMVELTPFVFAGPLLPVLLPGGRHVCLHPQLQ